MVLRARDASLSVDTLRCIHTCASGGIARHAGVGASARQRVWGLVPPRAPASRAAARFPRGVGGFRVPARRTIGRIMHKVQHSLHSGWRVRAGPGRHPTRSRPPRRCRRSCPGWSTSTSCGRDHPRPVPRRQRVRARVDRAVDWTYDTTFERSGGRARRGSVHDLVFDGLDTVAAVSLNGPVLAEVANQHRSYRLHVTSVLRDGENHLVVAFLAAVRYADAQSVVLGARPPPYSDPFNAIRKMACSFGWDWGLETATSGIWRPVRLDRGRRPGSTAVLVRRDADRDGWRRSRRSSRSRRADPAPRGRCRPRRADASTRGRGARARRRSSRRERPRPSCASTSPRCGAGGPSGTASPCSTTSGRGSSPTARCSTTTTRRVGFRDLRWNTRARCRRHLVPARRERPAGVREGRELDPRRRVPGRVTARATRARLRRPRRRPEPDPRLGRRHLRGRRVLRAVRRARPAHLAGLPLRVRRVLGGGAAARRGLGGGARQRRAPRRTRRLVVPAHRQQREPLGLRGLGLEAAPRRPDVGRVLLPRAVSERCSTSSHRTFRIRREARSPRRRAPQRRGVTARCTSGTLWNRKDWPHYRDLVPRFVAEFGWQGPPAWSTLTRAISDDPLTPGVARA